jgi:uncharacterized protein (TIGR03083 family)
MTRRTDRIVPISRSTDAAEVATAAYEGLLALLEDLDTGEWSAPTECPGWDVTAMVAHLVGAAAAAASVRENLRQQWWGHRESGTYDGNALDAANALQVRENRGLGPVGLVDELRRLAPAAVRGRMRLPTPLRAVRVPLAAGGSTAPGMPQHLSLGRLVDVVYTRDVWLHTVDIARATGRDTARTTGRDAAGRAVDARIVEDVVAEWVRAHATPVSLTLLGPAGGRFVHGRGGGTLRLDAVEACRVLSGRADVDEAAVGLVADPPGTADLLRRRVVF